MGEWPPPSTWCPPQVTVLYGDTRETETRNSSWEGKELRKQFWWQNCGVAGTLHPHGVSLGSIGVGAVVLLPPAQLHRCCCCCSRAMGRLWGRNHLPKPWKQHPPAPLALAPHGKIHLETGFGCEMQLLGLLLLWVCKPAQSNPLWKQERNKKPRRGTSGLRQSLEAKELCLDNPGFKKTQHLLALCFPDRCGIK